MKNIYTMLAAAFVGVASMSAADSAPVLSVCASTETVKQTAVISKAAEVAVNPGADQRIPPPPSGGTTTTVLDYYTCTWSGETLLDPNTTTLDVEVTVDMTTGEATIAIIPEAIVIKATLDVAKKTLTIPNMQYIGKDKDGDVWFYLKGVDAEGNHLEGAIDATSTVGTVDGDIVTFPTQEIWAVGNPEKEIFGWYWLTKSNKLEFPKDPCFDPNEGWTSVGYATLMDGWVLPCFEKDQRRQQNWWQVELQQKDSNENVYRLVNPYRGDSPVADDNEFLGRGYIQFDVTDPDHVVFEAVECGFKCEYKGVSSLYCMNELTYKMGSLGATAEEVIAAAAQSGETIAYTTFKDGVVTLNSTWFKDGYKNDARVGDVFHIYGGYVWKVPGSGFVHDMITKIMFPDSGSNGVESVVAGENADAPVEYFNLQGVRVLNPEAGQLVIKRQGNEVKKVVIR